MNRQALRLVFLAAIASASLAWAAAKPKTFCNVYLSPDRWNTLLSLSGNDKEEIRAEVRRMLATDPEYKDIKKDVPPQLLCYSSQSFVRDDAEVVPAGKKDEFKLVEGKRPHFSSDCEGTDNIKWSSIEKTCQEGSSRGRALFQCAKKKAVRTCLGKFHDSCLQIGEPRFSVLIVPKPDNKIICQCEVEAR